MTPSSSFRLLPKEVLWPFRFPWYRTQVTKASEEKKNYLLLLHGSASGKTRPFAPTGAGGFLWATCDRDPFHGAGGVVAL